MGLFHKAVQFRPYWWERKCVINHTNDAFVVCIFDRLSVIFLLLLFFFFGGGDNRMVLTGYISTTIDNRGYLKVAFEIEAAFLIELVY